MLLDLLTLATDAVPEGPGVTDSANWFLENAWIIPALPALSFLVILFFGKRMPRGGSEVGIAAVGLAFVLALITGGAWIDHRDNYDSHADEVHATAALVTTVDGGQYSESVVLAAESEPEAEGEEHADEGHEEEHPSVAVQSTVEWLQSGGHTFTAGTLIDGQAVLMLFVVTLISLLVHFYSTDYVAGDRRYTHFFAFLSLFTASMLLYVVSDNILQMIVGWELVGVCSFALIGHWWEDKANSDAALKAFLTNRVGDIGLLVGMTTLYHSAGGTFDTVTINQMAVAGEISHTALLVASCSLMLAVMSKSGQFILHTWLPDAMAGPTPVSALIHAATMVVAGIYLIARLYPVFYYGMSIPGSSINLLAVIGAITLLFGGLLAFVQDDIKKVLAYSTISQLGYMALALGVGAWTAALFHLFTHAFFKACLFLGAGSVSHSVHSFDMKKDMGGMRKYMPQTYRTFVIGTIALAGLPPLAGFWSKDEILAGTGGWGFAGGTGGNGSYTALLVMSMIGAAVTAAYMTRTIYLTFFGEFRGHGHPHESGPRIVIPLWILAGFALVAGFFNFPKGFQLVPESMQERFGHFVEPVASYFPPISHATPSWTLAIASTIIALSGVFAAYYYYFVLVEKKSVAVGQSLTELPDGPTSRFGILAFGHKVLVNKYYLDYLYNDVIMAAVKGPIARAANWTNQHILDGVVNGAGRTAVRSGKVVYERIDQGIIDGVVNGTGLASDASGQELRGIQSGRIQNYAAILFASGAILAGIFILVI